jgi:hypothetical protein
LADAIGISPTTAMKHAELADTDYLRYAGGRARAPIVREGADR